MNYLHEAVTCLLRLPLRAAYIVKEVWDHLAWAVGKTLLALAFLMAALLFPITLPILAWVFKRSDKLDTISRANAEKKLDEHYGHLHQKVKRRTDRSNLDCLTTEAANNDPACKAEEK